MAILGYLLTVEVGGAIIASSTDVSVDLSGEALDATTQTSGLHAEYLGGKVSGTVSGSYLLAADGSQFATLFALLNGGTSATITVQRNGTDFITADGFITSLSLSGGNSDSLTTGAYTIQLSGDPA